MKPNTGSHLTSDDEWLRIAWREVIRSKDFAAALVTFPPAFAIALDNDPIRGSGQGFLIAIGALGVALAGLVGGILAILTAWFDDTYRTVLESTKGGWRGAMRPYKITATLGLVTALVATASLFIWSIANPRVQSLSLALTFALFVWTLIGTIQIVGITFFHGEMRNELLKGMGEARKALARRRNQKRVG